MSVCMPGCPGQSQIVESVLRVTCLTGPGSFQGSDLLGLFHMDHSHALLSLSLCIVDATRLFIGSLPGRDGLWSKIGPLLAGVGPSR